jgi:hypothetical protein
MLGDGEQATLMGQLSKQHKGVMNMIALVAGLLAGGKSVLLFGKYKELVYVFQ